MTPARAAGQSRLRWRKQFLLKFSQRHFTRGSVHGRNTLSPKRCLSGFAVALNGSAQSLLPIYAKLNVILVTLLPVAGLVTDLARYLTIWGAMVRMRKIRRLAGSSHPSHLPTSAPYARCSRSAFNAPPQAMTGSITALTDFSCWEAGLKTPKFSKS